MKLLLSVMTLVCAGMVSTEAIAQMPKKLPAKSPKQSAQEYLQTPPSQNETINTDEGVFDVQIKQSVPSFDYEQALQDSESKKPVAKVKRPQLVVGARKAQKRNFASAKGEKIKIYKKAKKKSR